MKKIYLFCSAGMSTSMLANIMQEVADAHNLPLEVKAFPDGKIDEIVEEKHPDVILLGPQVKYRYKEIARRYQNSRIPIEVINSDDYGMMNGEKILKHAIKLIKSNK
ncbi:MAG: PTS sugar transporter subunit IIB [Clostridium baratii]|uniref:PTS sugar transporter subunit IIB n=1 Tax=Clostridium baratii TaxID=1561 RepID=UPI0006C3ACE5|nr:PTS sugar transporter subunit IIB [Clostridium baratii]MBS6005562.1 PTS sugar transporter subunit IIB [Clostridium baratii]CUP31582.1 PTS system lactose/cellobiose-specific transporter subunit IIB [Clostridium baratii]